MSLHWNWNSSPVYDVLAISLAQYRVAGTLTGTLRHDKGQGEFIKRLDESSSILWVPACSSLWIASRIKCIVWEKILSAYCSDDPWWPVNSPNHVVCVWSLEDSRTLCIVMFLPCTSCSPSLWSNSVATADVAVPTCYRHRMATEMKTATIVSLMHKGVNYATCKIQCRLLYHGQYCGGLLLEQKLHQ